MNFKIGDRVVVEENEEGIVDNCLIDSVFGKIYHINLLSIHFSSWYKESDLSLVRKNTHKHPLTTIFI